MRRQVLVNAALVALALGTLGVLWATRDVQTTMQGETRKSKLLVVWNKDDVSRIRLRRAGAELELVRVDAAGEFRIARPWQERADVATVSALLGSLELASALRPADGVAAEAAGLGTPGLELQLEMADKTQRIRLGGPAPAPPGARYLEVVDAAGARHVYTVSQGLVSELDLPWDKFREARLLELGRSDIGKLTIESPAGRVELAQDGSGFMLLGSGGSKQLAEGAAVEKLLTALSRLATEHFVEPELARTALGSDPLRLRLEPRDSKQAAVTLTLGSSCPGAAEQALVLREGAGQNPKAGCVPAEVGEALRVTPTMLELSRPFSVRPDEVEELHIVAGAVRLELARKGSGFVLKLPSSGEVALDAGNQRLGEIVGIVGRRVVEPKPAELGLEPAAIAVTIRLAASDERQSRSEAISVGTPRKDGSVCLKRAADGVVLCVAAEAARVFEPDASLLRSLELLTFAPSDLLRFVLQTPSLKEQVRRNPDGSFELLEPQGFRRDGALVSSAVQTLGTLRAERWAASQAEPAHGLSTPRLRVKVELGGSPPSERELLVGAETRGGFFASLSPDAGVFVVARASVVELETPLVDRSLCPVAPAELSRVELQLGKKQLALARRGDAWEANGISATRAAALGETLSSLRADFALHLGPARPSEGFGKPSLVVRFSDARGGQRRLLVGARDTTAGTPIAYARLDGVDATFALAASTVTALQDF